MLLGAGYFAVFGGEYNLFDLRRVREQRAIEYERAVEAAKAVEALQARRDSLLHDSATIERVAREKYGMIRPNERLYRFTDSTAVKVPADTLR
jgi:cell division protein FtsB